ncbi:MAG TPA: transposase [Verrucomicrobiae bacterium]|nr:transposase [Verrucomicrobiae bacterium]
MPRQLRIEYPRAIYHVMSRGDRKKDIYLDNVDRQDFLKTLAETCQKTGFEIHAYCLMRNHFHLIIETPNANLVAGMRWLLSTYTNRLNHRHKLFGRVFSGRYKAIIIEGGRSGYLRTACDYVHLNPVRSKRLTPRQRLLEYPWSSFGHYLAARDHRPGWLRVDRLLGEHGIQKDTAAARAHFEERMEQRRREAGDEDAAEWKPLKRGWFLGSKKFKAELLEKMAAKPGRRHGGKRRRATGVARAERIIADELKRARWKRADLKQRAKSHPVKLALALRLRKETTLTIREIAQRLKMGSWKSLNTKLYLATRAAQKPKKERSKK